METGNKRDITTTVEAGGRWMNINFANGKIIGFDKATFPPEIIEMAIMHGLKQKLVDAAAISRDPETGRTADIDDKYEAVKTVFDRLMAGEWNKPRESGEPRGGLLFAALVRLYPTKTPESLREWLAAKTKKEQAQLRSNPKIARIIDEIRAENTSDVDTDALLEELND